MKALISPMQDDMVVQIEQEEFPVAEPLFWVECPADVSFGFRFKDGQFLQPVEPEPVVVVPDKVSMRQARLALLQAGLLDQVQGAIDSLPSPQREAAQIEWEYATDVERNSQLVQMMTPALGLTDEQLDDLFILAATL